MLHKGDKPFMCDHCSKTFVSKNSLQTHLRNTHRILANGSYDKTFKQTSFPCDECGKLLSNVRYLKEHKLIHSSLKPFMCDKCSQTFSSKRRVQMHRSQKHTEAAHGPKPKSHICDVCPMS